MTRRKDPQADAPPAEEPRPEAEAALAEPLLVLSDPVGPPAEPEPMPSPAKLVAPAPKAERRRGGVLAPLLGGALAAIGGFALAHFDVLGLAAPDGSAEVTALTAQLTELRTGQAATLDQVNGSLAALGDRLAKLESAPAPAAPDLSRIDALDQRLAAIEAIPAEGGTSTAALTAKLAVLEQRLAAQPQASASPELQQKLDTALARLSEAEAAATARATEAETAAATAIRAQALDKLSQAVSGGQPFAAELQALGDATLTEALGALSETGAPTLASLQAGFPDPAREALAIARGLSAEEGWTDRLLDFLATQTGARPLTPLEGDTPDAVLSRAEFALSEGRVADALAELEPLDPAVKAPLDPWIAEAQRHLAAAAALQAARGE